MNEAQPVQMAQQANEAGLIGIDGDLGHGRVSPFPHQVQRTHLINFLYIDLSAKLNVENNSYFNEVTPTLTPPKFYQIPAQQNEPEQVENTTN